MSLPVRALVGLLIAVPAAIAESPLTLVYSGETSQIYRDMKGETERLIAPAEYAANWIRRDQAALGDSFEQVVMIRFTGACEVVPHTSRAAVDKGASLATTALSGSRVLPFVEVNCDRTRALMAPVLNALPAPARDSVLGKALGRVLAHELYHFLAQATEHKERGVSKPCFRLADLIGDRFEFDPVSVAQMRPALASRQPSGQGEFPAQDEGPAGR